MTGVFSPVKLAGTSAPEGKPEPPLTFTKLRVPPTVRIVLIAWRPALVIVTGPNPISRVNYVRANAPLPGKEPLLARTPRYCLREKGWPGERRRRRRYRLDNSSRS